MDNDGGLDWLLSLVPPRTAAALMLASVEGATYQRVAMAVGWTHEHTLAELRRGLAAVAAAG